MSTSTTVPPSSSLQSLASARGLSDVALVNTNGWFRPRGA